MLTDIQIERYSRQIILPEVGGVGQERLLAAGITVLAEIEDLAPALNYLVGAGVGTIRLLGVQDQSTVQRVAAEMAELNPDVRIDAVAEDRCDGTLLVLAATNRVIEVARRMNQTAAHQQVIFARLGEPCLLVVLMSRPPCMACAHRALLAAIEARGAMAAPTAMVAAAETIKILLAVAPQPSRLIEFSRYESRSSSFEASSAAGCSVCG
jgi:hypothetical protein